MVGVTDISWALRGLMERAATAFPYTPGNYPKKQLACGFAFELSHALTHMMKTLGQIASESENRDHGGNVSPKVLREATVKMMVHALRLAVSLGMKPEEVARMVCEQTEPKPTKQ